MIGTLSHLSQVATAGRIYLSSIYEQLAGILSQKKHLRRTITLEVRQDIETWLSLLQVLPERQFRVLDVEESELPPFIY